MFNFNRQVRPKTFTYIPRYYDEDQERYDEMTGDAEIDPNDPVAMKSRISRSFKRGSYYFEKGQATKYKRKSNIRVLMIIAFLIGIVFYAFYNNAEDILKIGQ